jgi:hypothetical protein
VILSGLQEGCKRKIVVVVGGSVGVMEAKLILVGEWGTGH